MSDTPKARIATIKGFWAKPGVSLNKRLYTADQIATAATEAQSAIDSGESPQVFSMLTHHGARDPANSDVSATAGRLTKVGVDSRGWGTFEADIADTSAGRDVAALVTPDKPYLNGVSMASAWKSAPITTTYEGEEVETAEAGFALKGIDFTHSPGIRVARINSAEVSESLNYEAVPEDIFIETVDEATDPKKPYGDVTYADPGYQKDGKKRYPIDTKDHIRAAWSYINKGGNGAKYSSSQLSRIKGKIKSAARKVGINISEDFTNWGHEIIEAYVSMNVSDDPGDAGVFAYKPDGANLDATARAVAMAAMNTLAALEPDEDEEIYDDMVGDADEQGMQDCPNCGAEVPDDANFCPVCGTSIIAGESATEQKEGEMPDSKEQEGAPPEESVLTDREKLLVAEAIKATREEMSKPPEESDELKAARALVAAADEGKAPPSTDAKSADPPAGESALPSTPEELAKVIAEASSEAARVAVEAVKDSMIEEVRKSQGGPRRRGHVSKNILEQSDEELYGDDGPGFRGKNLRQKSAGELEKIADAVFSPVISDVAS